MKQLADWFTAARSGIDCKISVAFSVATANVRSLLSVATWQAVAIIGGVLIFMPLAIAPWFLPGGESFQLALRSPLAVVGYWLILRKLYALRGSPVKRRNAEAIGEFKTYAWIRQLCVALTVVNYIFMRGSSLYGVAMDIILFGVLYLIYAGTIVEES